jgi:SecD/SecF fusion protein
MIGVASGAYSSIFIASPVLTHWKEREGVYRHRRHRIESDLGAVPAYADSGSDVEPARDRMRRRAGRITSPEPENVSAAEFEQMKRDLALEEERPARATSTLTKRPAPARKPRNQASPPASPAQPAAPPPEAAAEQSDAAAEFKQAPDEAENDGMVAPQKPNRPKPKTRNRRHGRRR